MKPIQETLRLTLFDEPLRLQHGACWGRPCGDGKPCDFVQILYCCECCFSGVEDRFGPDDHGRATAEDKGGEGAKDGQGLKHAPFKYAARKKSEPQGFLYRFHKSRPLNETCLAQLACVRFCYVASTF